MSNNSLDNKRIAKNTLLLYARMLYSLFLSLFASRVILAALGFEDYGLYNVIGSVVSMFVFLRSAMGNSVNRFITYSIGKGEKSELNDVFSMSMMIHIGLAIIIVILSETIGLWFLNTHIETPEGRMVAVNWVYQFSILACAVSVICIPYEAEIIAHERMEIFAIIQVLNSTLNLAIVYAVKYYVNDKLIFYAFLLLLVQVMNYILYRIYCGIHFHETKFKLVKNKTLLKEMTGFAGWSLIGNVAYIGYTQGLNIILNIFFGPVVNAARGVAISVQGAVKGFVTNFQMAVNPQITKSYAQEDYERLHILIYSSSKFSFFLLYCIILPIAIESKTILHLWLGNVPESAVGFTILTLAIMLVDPLSNPLGVANNATGKIKAYQIIEGGTLFLIVPISYIVLKYAKKPVPESVFIVQLVIMYIVQILRVFLVCNKIKMSKRIYYNKVILRVSLVAILSAIIPLLLNYSLNDSFLSSVCVVTVSILSVLIFSYFFGLDKEEKNIVGSKLNLIIQKALKR